MAIIGINFIPKGGDGTTNTPGVVQSSIYETNGGNVGIGIANPLGKLHVACNANAWAGYFTGNSTAGQSLGVEIDAGTNTSDIALRVYDSSGTIPRLIVRGDGNVGIGLTNPLGKLHVAVNANTWAGYFTGNSTAGQSFGVEIDAGTNTSDRAFRVNDSSGTIPRLVVRGDGNVGIGVTSPESQLEVNGSVRINGGSAHNSIIVVAPPTGNGNNDRDAIQAAINALPTNGGTIILQQGTYVVNRAAPQNYGILLRNGVHLYGISMNGTVIQPNENGMSVFYLENIADTFIQANIENLQINNSVPRTGVTGINIGNNTLFSGQPCSIENVRIIGCNTGILVASWWTKIVNCQINNCTTGISLSYNSNYTNATYVCHCSIWGSTTGISIDGNGNQIVGNNIGNIAVNGRAIDIIHGGSIINLISGNYIESNSNCIGIAIACPGNCITANYFDLQPGNEIFFSSNNIKRANNVFGNYFGRKTSDYSVTPFEARASFRIETGYSDGSGNIFTVNGGSTAASAPIIPGTGTINSVVGNIVTANPINAFGALIIGARLSANGISCHVINKLVDGRVQVDGAPNWPSGSSFFYEQPIFAGLVEGAAILTYPGTFAYIQSILSNFNAIMDRPVNWYNGGIGIAFLYKLPLLEVVDDTGGLLSSRMIVRPDGTVGIGTTNPGARLEVYDGSANPIHMLMGTNDPTHAGRVSIKSPSSTISNSWASTVKVKAAQSSDRCLTVLSNDESYGAILGDVAYAGYFWGKSVIFTPGTISDSNPNIRLEGVTSTIPSGGNNGDIQIYESGTTRRLYVKINGTWRYSALT
jgi:hypothetical protein